MILRVFHPLSPPMQMHREEAEDIPASNPAPESKENTPAAGEEDIPDIDELELEDAEVDEVGLLSSRVSRRRCMIHLPFCCSRMWGCSLHAFARMMHDMPIMLRWVSDAQRGMHVPIILTFLKSAGLQAILRCNCLPCCGSHQIIRKAWLCLRPWKC